MTDSLVSSGGAQTHREGRRFTWRLPLGTSGALLASLLAWFVPMHLEHRRQREAIAVTERLGGAVHTHSTVPHWLQRFKSDEQRPWNVDEGIGPNWLRAYLPAERILNHFEVVDTVWADNGPGVHGVSSLTGPQLRWGERVNITDDDLAYIARFPRLKRLLLRETSVTDAGLRHLRGLKHLKELHLTHTRISDDAAETLAELEQLEILSLGFTRIGDKGLARLEKLPHLKTLDVRSTQVTEQGAASFRRRPGLQVNWSAPGQGAYFGG